MIVTVTSAEMKEIDRAADWEHSEMWDALRDSMVQLDDEHGEPTDEYGIDEGLGNDKAKRIMEAFWDAQERDENPYSMEDDPKGGMATRLHMLGQRIVRHMDYGLAYGFTDDDWTDG